MNVNAVQDALLVMFREQIDTWPILDGVAYGLSREGMTRLEIMRFYWDLMELTPSPFASDQLDLIGDYWLHLIGQCSLDQIVRLYDDPEDPYELADRVSEDVRRWVPPGKGGQP